VVLPRLVIVAKKMSRAEKDEAGYEREREQARAEWLADASPALAATSRQLDPGERDRIWCELLDRGMVDWAIVLERMPEDQPTLPRREQRRRREARPASAYFSASVFDPDEEGNVCDLLRLALVTHGVSRVYELHEREALSHEIDAAAMEVIYNGSSDAAWTDETFEWAIQVDHEDGALVVGDWLLPDLKGMWPGWRRWLGESEI
jgi:hypothetical protein